MFLIKKKTIFIIFIVAIIILYFSYNIGTGFSEITNVALLDYSLSEDGDELTFSVSIMSSIGLTRGFKDNGGGVKSHYLKFYSTFGGINSTFGAKHEFVLPIDEDDSEIYFNRANGGYELVLQKDKETGKWEMP